MEIPTNTNTYQVIRGLEGVIKRLEDEKQAVQKHIDILKALDKMERTGVEEDVTNIEEEILLCIKKAQRNEKWKSIVNYWVKDINARLGLKMTSNDLIKLIESHPNYGQEIYSEKTQTALDKIVDWADNYKCFGEGFAKTWEEALPRSGILKGLKEHDLKWNTEMLTNYIKNRLGGKK